MERRLLHLPVRLTRRECTTGTATVCVQMGCCFSSAQADPPLKEPLSPSKGGFGDDDVFGGLNEVARPSPQVVLRPSGLASCHRKRGALTAARHAVRRCTSHARRTWSRRPRWSTAVRLLSSVGAASAATPHTTPPRVTDAVQSLSLMRTRINRVNDVGSWATPSRTAR